MSKGSKEVIIDLVNKKQYAEAQKYLAKENGLQVDRWRSMLYRLMDDYPSEKVVVNSLLKKNPGDVYALERKKFTDLEEFHQREPRPTINIGRDNLLPVEKAILENMSFVSAADSKYFHLLLELIESIKATERYSGIDFCVLDCGLSESEKHFLLTEKKVKRIVDPGWDIRECEHLHSGYKAMIARPFLKKHFSTYRYFFWLDADCWVQIEEALDKLIKLCAQQGFGAGHTFSAEQGNNFWEEVQFRNKGAFISKEYFLEKKLVETKGVSVGAIIYDSESLFCKKWQEVLKKNIKEKGFNFFSESEAAGIAASFLPTTLLDHKEHCHFVNFISYQKGLFLYKKKPAGIIALGGSKKWRRYSFRCALDSGGEYIKYFPPEFSEFFYQTPNWSCGFRIFPWRFKKKLFYQLIEEMKSENST